MQCVNKLTLTFVKYYKCNTLTLHFNEVYLVYLFQHCCKKVPPIYVTNRSNHFLSSDVTEQSFFYRKVIRGSKKNMMTFSKMFLLGYPETTSVFVDVVFHSKIIIFSHCCIFVCKLKLINSVGIYLLFSCFLMLSLIFMLYSPSVQSSNCSSRIKYLVGPPVEVIFFFLLLLSKSASLV